MELVKSGESRYDEYEALLLERDQASKEAGQIWTEYTLRFGQLMIDIFEEKIECIRCKKTISFYQTAANHGGVADADSLEEYLERELAEYFAKLKKMTDDYQRCRDAKTSTPYAAARSKTLYRRLAKLLHPDINPETDRQIVLQDLWERIVIAYHHNDVKALSELEVLVRKALRELGLGETKVDIPDIVEKIEDLKEEIDRIRTTEPYTYGPLLEDEEASEKKKNELTEELESFRKYHKELDDIIAELLESGKVRIRWLMS